jgi:hypothetical protein
VNLLRWFTSPSTPDEVTRKNYINVEIDAIGVGLASAATPFLPVFLTRLGASNFQVSLLTAMPAVTGFFLAIFLGRFLQKQKQIIPWFSATRLGTISCYALTGIVTFFIPKSGLVSSILFIWALATIPQTILAVTFTIVMSAIAGPTGRYDLMSRRWSLLGLTTSIAVIAIGQILDRIVFPLNYQIVFISLSIGGLISYFFSRSIKLPDTIPPQPSQAISIKEKTREYLGPILHEKPFSSFIFYRFVFLTGTALATPLFPLYYVRTIHANDSWIAIINTVQTAILIIGYSFWTRQNRRHGSHMVLVWTTLGLSLYPILTGLTFTTWPNVVYAGLSGIFQGGCDLVFFDELMRTIPSEYSATFVSFAQSVQYLSTIIGPLVGSLLADQIGIPGALIVSGVIRLAGFILFALDRSSKKFPTQISSS